MREDERGFGEDQAALAAFLTCHWRLVRQCLQGGSSSTWHKGLICRAASPMILPPMSIRLIHLVDEHTREDAARLCSLLLRKLPGGEVSQQVVLMGRRPAGLTVPDNIRAGQVARPLFWPMLLALPLQRLLKNQRPHAVIAWSVPACAAAGATWRHSLVGVISDPADARDASRWLNALGSRGPRELSLICTNGTVRRRLVETGSGLGATAVIRPAVDFAELRRARETMSRELLGLPEAGRVLLTTSPPSRAGGQFLAAWAAAILHHIWPDASLIVPGTSREQQRIARLVEGIHCPSVYRLVGDDYSPAELLAVADVLVTPATGDVPTGWLAWAMAAGVPIIGSAVPCISEYMADRENGFLCKPDEPHALALRIRTAFESPEVMARCIQTARHQAYETFRAERCVEEFMKVVRNLAGGESALAGIGDAAIDA
jgi:glycosyltransferase involved in cell wall biosynthesis